MPITEIVEPAEDYALTTVDAVQSELGQSLDSDQQTAVSRLIQEASGLLQKETGRVFPKERVIERIGVGGYQHTILLERRPVTEVHSVKLGEDGGDLGSDEYTILNAGSGELYRRWGWRSTAVFHLGAEVHQSDLNRPQWFVEYTAGYVTPATAGDPTPARNLPYELERAVIDMVRSWFTRFGRNPSLKSEKIGRASQTFVDRRPGNADHAVSNYPPSVQRVIELYRDPVVL